jgi:hypothetical protein
VCRPKHVEQLRDIGIINSTTWLHLVASFYEIYITMHGSMNVKFNRGLEKIKTLSSVFLKYFTLRIYGSCHLVSKLFWNSYFFLSCLFQNNISMRFAMSDITHVRIQMENSVCKSQLWTDATT